MYTLPIFPIAITAIQPSKLPQSVTILPSIYSRGAQFKSAEHRLRGSWFSPSHSKQTLGQQFKLGDGSCFRHTCFPFRARYEFSARNCSVHSYWQRRYMSCRYRENYRNANVFCRLPGVFFLSNERQIIIIIIINLCYIYINVERLRDAPVVESVCRWIN